jgi:hypothetical protein
VRRGQLQKAAKTKTSKRRGKYAALQELGSDDDGDEGDDAEGVAAGTSESDGSTFLQQTE